MWWNVCQVGLPSLVGGMIWIGIRWKKDFIVIGTRASLRLQSIWIDRLYTPLYNSMYRRIVTCMKIQPLASTRAQLHARVPIRFQKSARQSHACQNSLSKIQML